MINIPTTEPTEIIAGDTLKFKISLADYPAGTWTLTYCLVKLSSMVTFVATADGADHLITVANTVTAAWATGNYKWESYASKTGERYRIGSGTVEIKLNLAAQATGYDTRTHVKKTLDALESLIEGKATRDAMTISIDGKSIGKMGIKELLDWRDFYAAKYQAELARENIKNGKPSGRRLLVRL